MFGHRNPDRPSDNQTMPLKSDLDLDMLDDLPDILADEPATPAAPPVAPSQTDQSPDDLTWQAAAPAILCPSVTQLLRDAETVPQRQPTDEGASSLYEPAPAISSMVAIARSVVCASRAMRVAQLNRASISTSRPARRSRPIFLPRRSP